MQTEIQRMLKHPYGQNFLKDFADQWLDLNLIDFTEPDRRLYPEFDVIVQNSMLAETHLFLQHLLNKNLSITSLMDSRFTFLNSRLARFYNIEETKSDRLQYTKLDKDSLRGGLLGQGAILKVTANGTTTSPILRGIWISERLLGKEIPPPPSNVPAVEPDIRGATSIRDQLEKHKSLDTCASCHKHFDPPGYALENFDPAGSWRKTYKSSKRGKPGLPIDSSYQLADGQTFNDVQQFRKIMVAKPDVLARGFVQQLLTYGTGAPISFTDRGVVDDIVDSTKPDRYGFASLVEASLTSSLFLSK